MKISKNAEVVARQTWAIFKDTLATGESPWKLTNFSKNAEMYHTFRMKQFVWNLSEGFWKFQLHAFFLLAMVFFGQGSDVA